MNMWMARNTLCIALFCCPSLCLAQQSSSDAGRTEPTIRAVSRLVTVDVVVAENGHPVRGLTKASFRVLEDGKEQGIYSFEEHTISGAPAIHNTGISLPAGTYSNAVAAVGPPIVLLLDALNTPVQDQQYLRKEMIGYLKEVPAGTSIAIFALGTRLRMVQGFTSDVGLLQSALDTGRGATQASVLLDQQSELATPLDGSANENALDVLDQFQAEVTTFQYDQRIQNTLDAMRQLTEFLGALPGRKNLIWLSGSFPLALGPDESANNPFLTQRTYSDQLQEISDAFAADRIAVYPVDVRGLLPQAMFRADAASPNSAGTPMRRRGYQGAPPDIVRAQHQFLTMKASEHATMQQLAEGTGGRAFYETNALKEAIIRATEDSASYYTLTYIPQNKRFNGKFRKIEVKLAPGNHHLAYRRGYYARDAALQDTRGPESLINPKAVGIQRGAPPAAEILFKARVLSIQDPLMKDFHPRPGSAGIAVIKGPRTRYCIDYSISMHEVNAELRSDQLYHSALEVLAIAYDPEGKALNIVEHPFKLNLKPEEYEQLMRDGLSLHEEIDVPPGEAYLRIAVHDLATNQLGALEVPIGLRPQRP